MHAGQRLTPAIDWKGDGCRYRKSRGHDAERQLLPVASAARFEHCNHIEKYPASTACPYLSYARARATSALPPPPHAAASSASLLASSLLRSCMWHLHLSSSARTRTSAGCYKNIMKDSRHTPEHRTPHAGSARGCCRGGQKRAQPQHHCCPVAAEVKRGIDFTFFSAEGAPAAAARRSRAGFRRRLTRKSRNLLRKMTFEVGEGYFLRRGELMVRQGGVSAIPLVLSVEAGHFLSRGLGEREEGRGARGKRTRRGFRIYQTPSQLK